MSSFASNILRTTMVSGSSLSGAVEIGDNALVAIIADANISPLVFKGSVDGVHYYDINDGGANVYSISLVMNTMTTLDLNQFLAPAYVKVQSGETDAQDAVGSDVVFQLITKEI